MSAALLDTNAFVMALTEDPRLPTAARAFMGRATRLLVSVISFHEIGQKVRLGKWPEMAPHLAGLEARGREDGFDLVPLTATAALDAALFDWDHRDPFDRLIAAVARREDVPVISSDPAFDRLSIGRIWAGDG